MWYQPSFQKILEDQILLQKNEGTKPTSHYQEPANLAFLMGTVPKFQFQKKPTYPAKTVVFTAPAHLTETQKAAYMRFYAWGFALPKRFSFVDLKAGFRKLAIQFHPDHGGEAGQFLELKEMFLILKESIK